MRQVETRSALSVWQQLLAAMALTVTEYHSSVLQTPAQVHQLVDGTAVFPGGSGLWRGIGESGPLPQYFPANPVMFVAHNFGNSRGFDKARDKGGEAETNFWIFLREACKEAFLPLDNCFFTNVLMGLKPGKAEGKMPSTPSYLHQSMCFMRTQVEIVKPRLIVSLGGDCSKLLRRFPVSIRKVELTHPSYFARLHGADRTLRFSDDVRKLTSALS